MVSGNIDKLLKKYDNGETSLQEEQELRTYFSLGEVPPHLESYRVLFQYFASTKEETFTKDVPFQTKKRSYIYQWISVAAVIVIMFGVFKQFYIDRPKSFNDLTHEQQLAYNQTKEAFDLLSSKFNDGTANVGVLGVVGMQFDKGAEKVEYVNEFSKTTNKILKKPNKMDHGNQMVK